ncbi:two-component system, response regulator YesN [Paenibacillus sp. yr247]|uniref:response regulator transcription factor n=1 Tax=Paenibacillus sp. yr247 TaxID=1761880 RepID=UPI0008902A38|nr:response regulator [Paenibacillus sp. yr247]SDN96894.1 two-component system, response regulator YesN [Paenibacillus sp. yr247]
MYSILLVDDEKMELEMLADYVRWGDMGIRVAGTAKNGREALQRMEELRPDIILTDVRMPIMDGLEFSRRAKQINRNVQIAFLSGHDEFHYIKAALSVEAIGYLLKPFDMGELQHLMEKVKQKCEEFRIASQTSEVLKESYLREIILEGNLMARSQWIEKLLLLPSMMPSSGFFQILYITIDPISKYGLEVVTLIRNFAQAEIPRSFLCQIKEGTFVLLCHKPDTPSIELCLAAEQLIRNVNDRNDAILSIGVSDVGMGLESLYDLCAAAKRANESKFYFGLGSCTKADEAVVPVYKDVNPESAIASLCHAISHLQESAAITVIQDFFDAMRTSKVERDLVCSSSLRLITAIEQHFANLLGDGSVNSMYVDDWKRITNYSTINEIEDHILDVSHAILALLKDKDKDKNLRITQQIASLIDRSFSRQLTIEDIAKQVYLSPNYVRTLFKEKTGETILEYLTRVRIHHAAELLKDKSKKIHEIAASVGYENVSYFCSVFQKFKGTTPNEYRKKLL